MKYELCTDECACVDGWIRVCVYAYGSETNAYFHWKDDGRKCERRWRKGRKNPGISINQERKNRSATAMVH